MPIIGKEFKESTWKPKFLIVFPCMLAIIIPRLISVGILTSYMKGYIFVILFLNVGINCLCNCKFLWRDAAEAIRGCLTNIFAPTIVIEEGSTFFIKSALVSQLMYGLSLTIFTLTTTFGGFESTLVNVWGKHFKLPQLTHESFSTIDHSCIFFDICQTELPPSSGV